jgi:hypothetical protein
MLNTITRNPLKEESLRNDRWIFSSYLTGNALLPRYEHQLVSGVYGKKSLFSVRPIRYKDSGEKSLDSVIHCIRQVRVVGYIVHHGFIVMLS